MMPAIGKGDAAVQRVEGCTRSQLHVCHPGRPTVCQTNVSFAFQACFKYLSYILINKELMHSKTIQSCLFIVSALGKAKNKNYQGLDLTIATTS